MAKGAAWMIAFKFISLGLGLVSTLILARLLVPADFGLVSMAMVLIAVLELLGAFNFDLALIHDQNAERHHYDTVWTFTVCYGLFSALILVLGAGSFARFYNEPRLAGILYVLAFSSAIGGLENVGIVAFRKDLNFHKEFKLQLSKRLVAFVITVTLALTFRNYWALVIGTLASRITGVIISYLVHPFRPRWAFSGGRDLLRFSQWMVINNALLFLHHRAVDFIIGKLSGPQTLGLYNIAHDISNLPTTQMVAPLVQAVFPGYARMSGEIAALRNGFLSVIRMVALVAVPVGAGIAITADLFVTLALGPAWAGAVPLIGILALYGILQALQSNTGAVYLAFGKTRTIAGLVGTQVTFLLPMLVWGVSHYGAKGAALATLTAAIIMFPINMTVLFRQLNLRLPDYLRAVWRPLFAAVIMYGIISMTRLLMHRAGVAAPAVQLAAAVLAGGIGYITTVLIAWKLCGSPAGAEQYTLEHLGVAWRRFAATNGGR